MRSGSMVLLLGLLLLVGCARPSVIANRNQVVVDGQSLQAAAQLAEERCIRFGRRAYFEYEGRSTHAFSCRALQPEQASTGLPDKTRAMTAPDLKKPKAKKYAAKNAAKKNAARKMSSQLPSKNSPEPKSHNQSISAKPIPLKRPKTKHRKTESKTAVRKTRSSEIKRARKGTIWVQVASGGERTEAKNVARQFIAQHADVIGTSSFTIQQANLGKVGTVYRSRVGPYKRFVSADNACQALKSRKLECLVVIR